MPNDVLPQISPPADATDVLDWSQFGPELLRRPFVGTVREAAGFRVRVEGIQRENATCSRRLVVVAKFPEAQLDSQGAQQFAAALSAAADEIEAIR